ASEHGWETGRCIPTRTRSLASAPFMGDLMPLYSFEGKSPRVPPTASSPPLLGGVMPPSSFEGKSPRVHPTAFVAPPACLVGDVTVEENASVWYGTVLRADFNPIVVRRGANGKDNAVIHVS